MEEVDFYLKHAVETMEKSLARLSKELSKIRAGKAMPNMLDTLNVDYYGNLYIKQGSIEKNRIIKFLARYFCFFCKTLYNSTKKLFHLEGSWYSKRLA